MPSSDRTENSFWTPAWRSMVFVLAAASIWCLLAEFYHLCSMRTFTICALMPATALLAGLALWDRLRGDRQLWRAVLVGAAAGLLAALAYDVFRLPFVYARQWGIASIVPPMDLFKVFPRFGAMILDQPVEQAHYSVTAQLVGWSYHFSNGITFGVMYLAMIGDARRRGWWWAIVMAVGLELGMLFTPYPATFNIPLTRLFIIVTLSAHLVFGTAMGWLTRSGSIRWSALQPIPRL